MVNDLERRVGQFTGSKYTTVKSKKRVSWSDPEVEAIARAAIKELKQEPTTNLLFIIQYAVTTVLPVDRQRKIASLQACPNVVEKFKHLWQDEMKPVEKSIPVKDMTMFSDEEVLREAGRRFDDMRKVLAQPMPVIPVAPGASMVRPKKTVRILIVGLEKYQFNDVEEVIQKEPSLFNVKLSLSDKGHKIHDANRFDHFIVMPHRSNKSVYSFVPTTEITFVNGGTSKVIEAVKSLI